MKKIYYILLIICLSLLWVFPAMGDNSQDMVNNEMVMVSDGNDTPAAAEEIAQESAAEPVSDEKVTPAAAEETARESEAEPVSEESDTPDAAEETARESEAEPASEESDTPAAAEETAQESETEQVSGENKTEPEETAQGSDAENETEEKEEIIDGSWMDIANTNICIAEQTYTGSPITPDVVIENEDKTVTLIRDIDYEVISYGDNVDAGSGFAVIAGRGNYSGEITEYFTIHPADISSGSASLKYDTLIYNGKVRTQSKTTDVFNANGEILSWKKDYEIIYKDNQNAGTATMVITGIGNYTGELTKTFTIQPRTINSKFIYCSEISDYTYNAKVRKPSVTVISTMTGQDVRLVKNTDYTIEYKNNKNAGTASVIIQGIGNYKDTKVITFTIKQRSLKTTSKVAVDIAGISNKKYTGSAIKPNPSVTVTMNTASPIVLKKNTDYTVSYKNNVNAGTASVIIRGKGNYKGTRTVTFTINKAALTAATLKYDKLKYTGKPRTQTRAVVVKAKVNGSLKTLVYKTDYKISYSDNKYIGTAAVTITGKGNYKNVLTKTFSITETASGPSGVFTSTDSLYDSNYNRLLNDQPINPSDPDSVSFPAFTNTINNSVKLSGVSATHVIKNAGSSKVSHIACGSMVCQGLCVIDNYKIISAYCADGLHGSVLYVYENNKYKQTVNLTNPDYTPFINHVGGLTYRNDKIYIAGSDDCCVYSVDFNTILEGLHKQDAVVLPIAFEFKTQTGTGKEVSWVTCYNDKIYVGYFYDSNGGISGNSSMAVYDPESKKCIKAHISLPCNQVQGAAFIEKNGSAYLLLNSSCGRANVSRLVVSKFANSIVSYWKELTAPNMAENIAVAGNEAWICFESAAKKYTGSGDLKRIRPLDRAISANLDMIL